MAHASQLIGLGGDFMPRLLTMAVISAVADVAKALINATANVLVALIATKKAPEDATGYQPKHLKRR